MAVVEDKTPHKKSKKDTGEGTRPKDSAKKKKKVKPDNEVIPEASDPLMEDREVGERKNGGKKKRKDRPSQGDHAEVDSLQVEALSKKEEKKRRRGDGDDIFHSDTDPQPKKKSKKVRERHETGRSRTGVSGQGDNREDKIQKLATESDRQSTRKSKKKKHKNKTGFPDPEEDNDTSFSSQARKALGYAFSQFSKPEEWKFNKARQNWLIRNFWSNQAVPEKYESLVVKYLSAVQGNTREHLIKTCQSMLKESNPSPKEQSPENSEREEKKNTGGVLIDTPSPAKPQHQERQHIRAKALLQELIPGADASSSDFISAL